MGDKVYKPIIKDGDHLIRSKGNPDRVRGLARDGNNKNQDIIEWEEYDLDDLQNDDYIPYFYEDDYEVKLTPAEEEIIEEISEALAELVDVGAHILYQRVIAPWWKKTARPWVEKKIPWSKKLLRGKKDRNTTVATETEIEGQVELDMNFSDVSSQIDQVFEQFYFDMDEEEAKAHMMKLIYHILGVVNEIRIISNSRIKRDCESEELCIERQKEVEKFLSEKAAAGLDKLLSNEDLQLDLNTARELFLLTGGGVRLNGEYVPVQALKIDEAMKAIAISD